MTNENYNAAKALKDGIAIATDMLVTGTDKTDIWPESLPATMNITELRALLASLAIFETTYTLPNDLKDAISTANLDYATALKAAITSYKGASETAFSSLGTS